MKLRKYDEKELKKLQQIELKILKEFISICDKHSLDYYLYGGTNLGAIRHSGFIPWDDDIDVIMFRDDYNKFLKIISEREMGEFKLINSNVYEDYFLQHSKLTLKNTKYLSIDTSKEMEVATREEIQEGEATILCQLDNSGPKEYKIEIEKIYISKNEDNKSMLIKITDESLIEKTGGIIQGMSGAPIMQNGKFIGAITNVLVNDPTQGYAIFGDMMIKQMREI